MTQERQQAKRRRIALYPGAFRPPHAAHDAAVRHLLTLPHIDEVVVIIANRCRIIPGTTQAFDTEVARKVWAMYLQGIENVRVEIAQHNAVTHALEYFEKVQAGDTLLFCLGEADFEEGDDRFRTLQHRSTKTGIHAEVLSAPTGSLPIRATTLRTALVQGGDRKEEFFRALPTHLTVSQAEAVWTLCRQSMREIGDIIQEKVRTLLKSMKIGPIQKLWNTCPGKIDPVFCVQLQNKDRLFIKYAGDTVGAGSLGQPLTPKPRRRLATERRALKCLETNSHHDVELPDIVHFEKKTWTLVLTEVCPGGRPLEDDLKAGIFNPIIASKASRFLAECHTTTKHVPPLWGNIETDRKHWKRMLTLRTVELRLENFTEDLRNDLTTLKLASENAEENRFVHLDFHPKNIFISKDSIGLIDFELSSSVGDPAYDLGNFLGHYVYWILTSSTENSWQEAIQNILHTYQQEVGDLWERMDLRVVAFTGVTLLNILERGGFRLNQDLTSTIMKVGAFLLDQGITQHGDPAGILCKAINDFS